MKTMTLLTQKRGIIFSSHITTLAVSTKWVPAGLTNHQSTYMIDINILSVPFFRELILH